MPLEPGIRLGPYEIVSAIGAGGMGEVYRAHDTKLQRDVALKLLPERFASDPERLARFEREARALASLNHPHIAHIYGFEESPSAQAFVMELVEGRTLAELIEQARVRRGRGLPIKEALEIATQLAAGIEGAHAQGVLHRDLKPANIKITPAGTVKVLDFGLAALASEPRRDASRPTITAFTERGVAMGTPAYMSPEQARGESVDRRTDMWAFGCILFEMFSGRRAFDGRTSSDTIAAVLTREPEWSDLPAETPPSIARLLRRCLRRDVGRRLRDAGDARLELEDASAAPVIDRPARPAERVGLRGLGGLTVIMAAVSLVAGYTGWRLRETPSPATPLRRFVIQLPIDRYDTTLQQGSIPFALSRDGSKLAYAAGSHEGSRLFVQLFDTTEPQAVPGTLSAGSPFFSPDGQWIGFTAAGSLRRVPVAGGPIEKIVDTGEFVTAAVWTNNGIFFPTGVDASKGIARVSPEGGLPEVVTMVNRDKGESGHLFPDLLPGGKALIFTVRDLSGATQAVLHSLETGDRRILLQGVSQARYVGSGHIIYAQGVQLMAVPFDIDSYQITGPPEQIIDRVSLGPSETIAQFDVADDGTMVYLRGVRRDQRSLAWVDRQGRATSMQTRPRGYWYPTLAPDDRQMVVRISDGTRSDLWLHQHDTDALRRITFAGRVTPAVWTPDGKGLVYAASHQSRVTMFLHSLGGANLASELFSLPEDVAGMWPGSWSADGRRLAVMVASRGGSAGDIMLFDGAASGSLTPIIKTPFTEWGARLSPDNRSIAYVSNESGRWQVHLRAFPGPGTPQQISTEGGTEVVWSRSGRELFYRSGPRMMAVAIGSGGTLAIGQTTVLFEGPFVAGQPGLPNYDVAADGRFVMIQPGPEEQVVQPLHVTLNWARALRPQ